MGAVSRSLAASQPPGAVFVALLTLYSGFAIPFRDMRPWLKWLSYINPVYYVFEAMVINEVFQLDGPPCPQIHANPQRSSKDAISTAANSYLSGTTMLISYVLAQELKQERRKSLVATLL